MCADQIGEHRAQILNFRNTKFRIHRKASDLSVSRQFGRSGCILLLLFQTEIQSQNLSLNDSLIKELAKFLDAKTTAINNVLHLCATLNGVDLVR